MPLTKVVTMVVTVIIRAKSDDDMRVAIDEAHTEVETLMANTFTTDFHGAEITDVVSVE